MKDLIERQIAFDQIGSMFAVTPTQKDMVEDCLEIIENLPSAQPETAKRIVGKSRNGMTLWYQCDMCNEPVDAQDNFCRECGRRLTDG